MERIQYASKQNYLGLPEEDVGVAERGVEDLDAHLHGLRRRHLHLLDRQRLAGLPRHSRCSNRQIGLSLFGQTQRCPPWRRLLEIEETGAAS
jgi:hypothetical protein